MEVFDAAMQFQTQMVGLRMTADGKSVNMVNKRIVWQHKWQRLTPRYP